MFQNGTYGLYLQQVAAKNGAESGASSLGGYSEDGVSFSRKTPDVGFRAMSWPRVGIEFFAKNSQASGRVALAALWR